MAIYVDPYCMCGQQTPQSQNNSFHILEKKDDYHQWMVTCRLSSSIISTKDLIRRKSMSLENMTGIPEESGKNWIKQNSKICK